MPNWQPIATAPKDAEALFWVVAKEAHEAYLDTSGKEIFVSGPPRMMLCKFGRWSSLSKATHWMPVPDPPGARDA